jgi:hypothetical protein
MIAPVELGERGLSRAIELRARVRIHGIDARIERLARPSLEFRVRMVAHGPHASPNCCRSALSARK